MIDRGWGFVRRVRVIFAVGLLLAGVVTAVEQGTSPARAQTSVTAPTAALIYIGDPATANVTAYNRAGAIVATYAGDPTDGYTGADALRAGDVNGDGVDDVIIGGDFTGVVDVYDGAEPSTSPISSFQAGYGSGDGFELADLAGDGSPEIVVIGDVTGLIEVFDPLTGDKLHGFAAGVGGGNDAFTSGDVDGDGADEIIVGGDVTSAVDRWSIDPVAGTQSNDPSTDTLVDFGDQLATMDWTATGVDDLLRVSPAAGLAQVQSYDGTIVRAGQVPGVSATFLGGPDPIAVGDLDGDGTDELAVLDQEGPVVRVEISRPLRFANEDPALPVDTVILDVEPGVGFAVGQFRPIDTDDDGLPDNWETDGRDVDGDGSPDLDLAALGADPMRRDMFVEIDCVGVVGDHDHCPDQGTLDQVVVAFANAPPENPDGSTGVALHLDVGDRFGQDVVAVIPGSADGTVSGSIGDLGGGNTFVDETTYERIAFDRIDDPEVSEHPKLSVLKREAVDPNRRGAFRWALFANLFSDTAGCGSPAGRAEFRGDDLMIGLGGEELNDSDGDGVGDAPCFPGGATGASVGSPLQQAHVFAHELGHTMGLQHGGDDEDNLKPNYPSIMNYGYTDCGFGLSQDVAVTPYPLGGCLFTRFALPDLDESSLDECAGFGVSEVDDPDANIPFDPGPVNWDGSLRDINGDGLPDLNAPSFSGATCDLGEVNTISLDNLAFDLNADGVNTVLSGFDDWDNVSLRTSDPEHLADTVILPEVGAIESTVPRPRIVGGVTWDETAGAAPEVSLTIANVGDGPALGMTVLASLPDGAEVSRELATVRAGDTVSVALGSVEVDKVATDVASVEADIVWSNSSGERDASSERWHLAQRSDAEPTTGGAIDLDGPLLAVGAPGDDVTPGRVLLYRRTESSWSAAGEISAPADRRSARFGAAVAVAGNLVAVGSPGNDDGAGAVVVYDVSGRTGPVLNIRPGLPLVPREPSGFTPVARLSASDSDPDGGPGGERNGFGASLDLVVDTRGARLVIGAPGDGGQGLGAGAIHHFVSRRVDGAGWGRGERLVDPTGATGDGLGTAVAMIDGVPAGGAPGAELKLDDEGVVMRFGEASVEKLWGSDVGLGAGARLGASVATADDGGAAALNGLGSPRLVVGAPGAEAAVVTDAVLGPVQTLVPPPEAGVGSSFGSTVAITSDAVAVGPRAGGGPVRIYVRAGDLWLHHATRSASVNEAPAMFGASVALDGSRLAVGEPASATGGGGRFYVMERDRPRRAPRSSVTVNGKSEGDWFVGPATVVIDAVDAFGQSGGVTSITVDGVEVAGNRTQRVKETEGVHKVEFWATDEFGNAEARHEVEVAIDLSAPTLDVLAPAEGATYQAGQRVVVDFECDDESLVSCEGDVAVGDPLDTCAVGRRQFAVRATDAAGRTTTEIVEYSVAPALFPPPLEPRSPAGIPVVVPPPLGPPLDISDRGTAVCPEA